MTYSHKVQVICNAHFVIDSVDKLQAVGLFWSFGQLFGSKMLWMAGNLKFIWIFIYSLRINVSYGVTNVFFK